MVGWLVVNCFLDSHKYIEIYDLLKNGAKDHGIDIEIIPSDRILCQNFAKACEYKIPDFVLFWDKDIVLARKFEMCGIPVFNSAHAIEVCDSKKLTFIYLDNKGIPTPKTICAPMTFEGVGYKTLNFLDYVISTLGFPFILKEEYGSFGQQVYMIKSKDEAISAINKANGRGLIFQEFISTSCGKDIRVNVVGGKVVASMMRYNENDFRSNITNGGKMMTINISKEQEDIAIKACNAIGLDFAGVDILFGKDDTPIVCEINSNPHFKSTLDCTGIDMSKYIIAHVISKLKLC